MKINQQRELIQILSKSISYRVLEDIGLTFSEPIRVSLGLRLIRCCFFVGKKVCERFIAYICCVIVFYNE